MERRLAAIVAADVVGYSRMIRSDEDGTIAALRALRAELIDPAVAKHRGRIVKLMGDGVLVEYASVVDAVASAVEIQQGAAARNADIPEDRRIVLRVGVNLGDVVIDGDDIQGDGVNLAARLEALAAPGAVCVADSVHDQVRDRLDLVFADLGERQVKNIDRPIRVWQWSDGDLPAPAARPPEAPPLPAKPSVAVLPFDNMSADPEQEYFADGVAEDVITALSRSNGLFVIARNSSFAYRGRSVDIRQVGRELGVRYVLEGSVRRAGNRVRITAQLIEAASGNHVWVERYDRPLDDIFEVQDEITTNVTGMVGNEIMRAELNRMAQRGGDDLPAWDRVMRAQWHINQLDPEHNARARAICEAAIEELGATSDLHATIAQSLGYDLLYPGWSATPPADIAAAAGRAAAAAIRLDPESETAHGSMGFVHWMGGDLAAAIREARTAIRLNPNFSKGIALLGNILAYCGAEHRAEAQEHLDLAVRLGPRDPFTIWPLANLAMMAMFAGAHDKAIDHARLALDMHPDFPVALRYLAAAEAHSGRIEEARATWRRAEQAQPMDLEIYAARIRRLFQHPEDAEILFAGLRLAGAEIE
jgi:adenylate cyclase